jgi:hypothetical protein
MASLSRRFFSVETRQRFVVGFSAKEVWSIETRLTGYEEREMKKISILASLLALLSVGASANVQCMGETYDGTIVETNLITKGAGFHFDFVIVTVTSEDGEVSRFELYDQSLYALDFGRGLMDFDMVATDENGGQAIVSYKNEKDYGWYGVDLLRVLTSGEDTRTPEISRFMSVSNGQGLKYRFKDTVCAVSADP